MKRHCPLLLLTLLSAVAVFWNLGGAFLWSDEGDTVVFARSILSHGIPKAWDGRVFLDEDFGDRVNDSLVMTGTPWVPYYLCAASLKLFGNDIRAARLPFALAALLCIPALYLLVLSFTKDPGAAWTSSVLLALSPQFLLYARQARYPALSMLLACLLLIAFSRLRSRSGKIGFVVASVMFFYTHPIAALAALVSVSYLTLSYKPLQERRETLAKLLVLVGALLLPWLWVGSSGISVHAQWVLNTANFFPRLTQFLIEWLGVAPLAGWALLWLWGRAIPRQEEPPSRGEFRALLAGHFIAYAFLISASLSSRLLWEYGVRYYAGIIPLSAAVSGMLVSRVSGNRKSVWACLVAVLAFTRLGGGILVPPAASAINRPLPLDPEVTILHRPAGIKDWLFKRELWGLMKELRSASPGTVAQTAGWLKEHASAEDIVITNYEWEALYVHTGLRQGWKLLPERRIYSAARKAGLPDYVFDGSGARWIVWRHLWDGYGNLSFYRLSVDLHAQGARLIPEASFQETHWENRYEQHFHRFQDMGVLFDPEKDLPETRIYRVEWPDKATGISGESLRRKRKMPARASSYSSKPSGPATVPTDSGR